MDRIPRARTVAKSSAGAGTLAAVLLLVFGYDGPHRRHRPPGGPAHGLRTRCARALAAGPAGSLVLLAVPLAMLLFLALMMSFETS
jgi:hypothetical protein